MSGDNHDHKHSLANDSATRAATRVDSELHEICGSFDFLLGVSPTNTADAWRAFKACKYEKTPEFSYRDLTLDISDTKRRLHDIELDDVDDPVLLQLFEEKQRELDLQLTLLGSRNTEDFSDVSMALYGIIEESLAEEASAVLEKINSQDGDARSDDGGSCSCQEVQEAAEELCEVYRKDYSKFDPKIVIRDDVAGLLVSGGQLLIAKNTSIKHSRLDALLSHEVSVHLLTYYTGDAQELKIFSTGLAGYEGIQEGLGVFAEYCVDGLSELRIKLLAARVVAVNSMLNHATFIETFRLLYDTHNYTARGAFNITARVYRSGGLAKDAIYFRSFAQLLDMLADGQKLDPFWFGKIDVRHIDAINQLHEQGFLTAPPITPEFLSRDQAQKKLDRARKGLDIIDLV